jgi:hypothetical protein
VVWRASLLLLINGICRIRRSLVSNSRLFTSRPFGKRFPRNDLRGSNPLDPQVTNWILREAAAGFVPTDAEITAASTYMSMINAAGIRSLKKYVNLMATSGGIGSALIPLIDDYNPPMGITPSAVGSPTTSAAGVGFNGTSQYLNSGIAANLVSCLNGHMMVAVAGLTFAATTQAVCGARTGATTPAALLRVRSGGTSGISSAFQGTGAASGPTAGDTTDAKIMHVSSVASNDLRNYKNGVQIGTTFTTVRADPLGADNFFIMGRNSSGSSGELTLGTLLTYSFGLGMTPVSVAFDAAAFEAALDVLGRGVIA